MKRALVILLALAVLAAFAFALLTPDRSGEVRGDCLYWNGARYVPCDGAYSEGRTIARAGDWQINEVLEDETHTFVVLRSFLDQYLMVRDDYEIPAEGEITRVAWRHETITDPAFCEALGALLADIAAGNCEEAGDLPDFSEDFQNYDVLVGYGACPIATNFVGYLWETDGDWYFAAHESSEAVRLQK